MKDFRFSNGPSMSEHPAAVSSSLDAENDNKKREAASVNINSIANICNCTVDQVTQFLIKTRDTVLSTCAGSNKPVCLNISVG